MVISLVSAIYSYRSGVSSFVESVIVDFMSPFEIAFDSGVRSADRLWRGYTYLVNVERENERLSARVKELQGELGRLREDELKLWRLQKLMGFNLEKHVETVPVEVVGRESDNWSRMILLNRGRGDGIDKGMAVITSEGLVGRVVRATDNKAWALLLTDWRSSVDALVQRTRVRGVVVGQSSQVDELKYIPLDADVMVGDKVVSSGLGGVYPKGLMVGTVSSVVKERNGLFQKVTVIPTVNTDEVEEALVVTRYGE